jgi:predicted transposase/invertase (TIGR01784 family)
VKRRYIDPTTDFGFKRIFGQHSSPESMEILKAFLFDLLSLPHPIKNLTFMPTEQIPQLVTERISIFDVYCIDEMGNQFIVEMQRNRKSFFKERTLYYSTFPITNQVRKGYAEGSPFKLLPIYVTSILNFTIGIAHPKYIHRYQIMDTETCEVFTNTLNFIFVELPKFQKTPEQLETGTDRWLYLLRHMHDLYDIPEPLRDNPYQLTFRLAEESILSEAEWHLYHGSLKTAYDEMEMYNTGLNEGLQQGEKQGKREVAQKLLEKGLLPADIADLTGLSLEDITALAAL